MSSRLLIASDFDGTAAAIRTDPGEVLIDPAWAAFFRRAAATEGVDVALISGRDVEDLARRAGGLHIWLAGSHGLDVVAPDGSVVRQEPAIEPFIEPSLEREILDRGLRLELKKHGIGLHWRGVEGIDENHPVVRKFRDAARSRALKLIDGRAVVEARMTGPEKGDALRLIAAKTRTTRVVFAGDDLTDIEACRAADRGIFLVSAEREAPERVETVSSREDIVRIFEEELSAVKAQTEELWQRNR